MTIMVMGVTVWDVYPSNVTCAMIQHDRKWGEEGEGWDRQGNALQHVGGTHLRDQQTAQAWQGARFESAAEMFSEGGRS